MADENQQTIYRLTDIDTREVSIVDLAANNRRFLLMKSTKEMAMKKGAPVVDDGKGGHTVAKETPPAPAPAAPPPEPPAPQASEPVLALSPEMKAELVKRLAAAKERLEALSAMIEKATESPGLVELPAEIATKVAELLTGIAQGEVTKGLPQFSSVRTAQLQAAYDALGAVLGSVAKPAPAPEPAPAAEVTEDELAKAISRAVLPLEEKLAKALERIATTVAQHGDAIAKQSARVEQVEKARPTPRSGAVEGRVEKKSDDEDDGDVTEPGGWPLDMADPDKHDVKKVDKSVRFTVG